MRARRALVVAVVVALALAAGVLGSGVLGGGTATAGVASGPVTNAVVGCLEDSGGSTTPGAKVALAACGTGPAQQWSRWADGTLRAMGLCADLRGGSAAANTLVVLAPCGTAVSQRWTARTDGRLVNQRSALCLQPYRGRAQVGLPMSVAGCTSADVQRWTVPALSTAAPVPPVTTPPATTPPVTPPATTPLWTSDFTGSGLTRFASTPWNLVGAPAPVLVASPVTPDRRALAVTMPGGGTRAEVEPATPELGEGADRWFGFSFVLPAGFPVDVTSWQLLTQWKNDGEGSPPLQLTVGQGRLWLSGGYGHPAGPRTFSLPVSAATTGTRIDLTLHVVFSRDPARGSVDVWRDGVPAVVGYHPPGGTLYPTTAAAAPTASLLSYWKMGLYRDSAIVVPARYTIESAAVGTSAAAVAVR